MTTPPDLTAITERLHSPAFQAVLDDAGYHGGSGYDTPVQVAARLAERDYYLTADLARASGVPGHNLRCNRCGTYGATWTVRSERPGWGSLALCTAHHRKLQDEYERHERALRGLRHVYFEQDREGAR